LDPCTSIVEDLKVILDFSVMMDRHVNLQIEFLGRYRLKILNNFPRDLRHKIRISPIYQGDPANIREIDMSGWIGATAECNDPCEMTSDIGSLCNNS
jgi:hypothetical protein